MTTSISAGRTPRTKARAEVVGSLLRPSGLRELFPEVYEGQTAPSRRLVSDDRKPLLEQLDRKADLAIAEVVQRQIDLGMDVVTDGELRRAGFMHSMVDALGGTVDRGQTSSFSGRDGQVIDAPTVIMVGTERLYKADNPALQEVKYVQSLTDFPLKVTFPAPSYWYAEPVDLEHRVYSDHHEFVREMMKITRELVDEVIAAGVRYVQFDWPAYVMAIDPKFRDGVVGTEGQPLDQLIDSLVALDNEVLDGLPADVTTALHICRGNYRSSWLTEGSLEPIAEQIFNQLAHDRLLIEWENQEREGDFSPLRFVPRGGPDIVMGVVSSKVPEIETVDEVQALVEEAAEYVDIQQLAVSPQCGFASSWEGNTIADEIQWRKLEVVGEVADRIWGTA